MLSKLANRSFVNSTNALFGNSKLIQVGKTSIIPLGSSNIIKRTLLHANIRNKASSLIENSHQLRLLRLTTQHTRGTHAEKIDTKSEHEEKDGPVEERQRKIIAVWLFICSGLVFAMIVLGGVTRLTESGLSIVDWKPVVGSKPPLTQEEWEEEFAKYRESPEYKKLNFGMSLEDFKKIFWMEWSHRELGRFIGLAYGLPFFYFAYKKWLRGPMLAKGLGLLAFGGFQGALGWFMVKSGLDPKNFEEDNSVPRVSQYRLAAHLTSALLLYSSLFWIGMGLINPKRPNHQKSRFAKHAHIATALVFTTAFSGAFVAGLDAGLIYNTFPLMGGEVVPEGMWTKKPLWKNFFENDTTVQFNHRVLGVTTFSAISGIYLYALRSREWNRLPKTTRLAFHSLFGVAALQVTLGISTLLSFVPVHLAATHQAGAISLLTVSLWLMHLLKRVPK